AAGVAELFVLLAVLLENRVDVDLILLDRNLFILGLLFRRLGLVLGSAVLRGRFEFLLLLFLRLLGLGLYFFEGERGLDGLRLSKIRRARHAIAAAAALVAPLGNHAAHDE